MYQDLSVWKNYHLPQSTVKEKSLDSIDSDIRCLNVWLVSCHVLEPFIWKKQNFPIRINLDGCFGPVIEPFLSPCYVCYKNAYMTFNVKWFCIWKAIFFINIFLWYYESHIQLLKRLKAQGILHPFLKTSVLHIT